MHQNKKMNKTESRKLDHIKICTEKDVQSGKTTLFECVEFLNSGVKANASEIDTSVRLFGKQLNYPIIIAGMTGGVSQAEKINKNLAQAAEELGIGFGVGSQRAMLENPLLKPTYEVRDVAPDILLLGNIGISQLFEYSSTQIRNAMSGIKADAVAVHMNSLQELMQPEGSRTPLNYSDKIKTLCERLDLPVLVKETGMGISKTMAERLNYTGLSGIDVGGAGGTSFARVELERGGKKKYASLEDDAVPTAQSVLEVRKIFKNLPVIATGGIRSGLDIAKAIALGANAAGIALPLLKPAQESSKKVLAKLEKYISELKAAMAQAGASSLSDLGMEKIKIGGELQKWL